MNELIELLHAKGNDDALEDRYRGVMLGVAVGNALGLGAEGWSSEQIRLRFGRITEVPATEGASPWDDDVAQTVILAQAILEHGRLDLDDVGRRLLEWFRENGSGIGFLTRQVMTALMKGTPAEDAARLVWEGSGKQAAGNGAVMRCWPVALRWRRFPQRMIREARSSALVTHYDPRCEWSTVASVGVAVLAFGDRPLDNGAFAGALEAAGAPPAVGEALRAAAGASLEDLELDDGRSMGYTLKALQVAAWCTEQEPDFEQVVGAVINAGGDTDTNGAVAGAILGARLGARGVPIRWRDAVGGVDRLLDLANRLHDASLRDASYAWMDGST